MANRSLIFLFIVAILCCSCSYQVRTADAGIDYNGVTQNLDSLMGTSTSAVGSSNQSAFQQIMSGAAIYYSEGPGPLGTAASVLSFNDFTVFGLGGLDYHALQDVQIYFLDQQSNGSRANALAVAISTGGGLQATYFVSQGPPDVSDGVFTTTLSGDNGNLTLTTTDIDSDGNFYGVIGLKAYDDGGNFIGQFSTLVGFSQ